MNKIFIYRLIIDILLAFSILNGWWFVATPLAIIGAWRFPFFVEIIIAGIAYDSLFGLSAELGLWGYAGTIISIVILGIIAIVKKMVR